MISAGRASRRRIPPYHAYVCASSIAFSRMRAQRHGTYRDGALSK